MILATETTVLARVKHTTMTSQNGKTSKHDPYMCKWALTPDFRFDKQTVEDKVYQPAPWQKDKYHKKQYDNYGFKIEK
jgi:hypothetical protein